MSAVAAVADFHRGVAARAAALVLQVCEPKRDPLAQFERHILGDAVHVNAPASDTGAIGRAEVHGEQAIPLPEQQQMRTRNGFIAEHTLKSSFERVNVAAAAEDDTIVERVDGNVSHGTLVAAVEDHPNAAWRAIRRGFCTVGRTPVASIVQRWHFGRSRSGLVLLGSFRSDRNGTDDAVTDTHRKWRVDRPSGSGIVEEKRNSRPEIDQPKNLSVGVTLEQAHPNRSKVTGGDAVIAREHQVTRLVRPNHRTAASAHLKEIDPGIGAPERSHEAHARRTGARIGDVAVRHFQVDAP